jgi:hypothetical protein
VEFMACCWWRAGALGWWSTAELAPEVVGKTSDLGLQNSPVLAGQRALNGSGRCADSQVMLVDVVAVTLIVAACAYIYWLSPRRSSDESGDWDS